MSYPNEPGQKGNHDTGIAAAEGIAARAPLLRDRVMKAIEFMSLYDAPGATAEEVAAILKEPVHSIRPRVSELHTKGLIVDGGERGTAMGGRRAIRWRVKA